jgi:hypothetical protein
MGETLATILEVIEGEAGQRNTKVEVLRLDKVKLRWYRDVTKRYKPLRADERERETERDRERKGIKKRYMMQKRRYE